MGMEAADTTRLMFEIPARADLVSFARLVVAAAAEVGVGIAPDRVEDLKLAVSEAVTNGINAQARVDRDDRIQIECLYGGDAVTVIVHDHGGGFDPQNVPRLPDVEDPERLNHESGLGLSLIATLTDESEVAPGEDGTDVTMVVYSAKRQRNNVS